MNGTKLGIGVTLGWMISAAAVAQVTAHTVATGIRGGYQVAAADLNDDGRTDIIALGAAMDELVWFENPSWERHVITREASRMINLDTADIDGDGIPEIGLAYGFSIDPSQSEGNVAILEHDDDPTAPWTLTEIDTLPMSHRVRWADIDGRGRPVLVNAPILNAEAEGFADPERHPTPLVFYRPGDWAREMITLENVGVVHGLLIRDWDEDGRDEVLTAGRLGVHVHGLETSDQWTRRHIVEGEAAPYPDGGSSDLGAGTFGNQRFFTAIEPFHGHQVVVYGEDDTGRWQRRIIDTELVNGHSMVVADFDADGNDDIVAGGTRGEKLVYLYRTQDGAQWQRTILDDTLAANSCAVADINADGTADVACIDNREPWSVKWYEIGSRD